MKKYLFIFIFVSIAQLFYGQGKYTIQGELPDHSLDDSYLRVVSGTPINEDYSTYMIGTKRSMENQLLFLEKYAQYPDVVRFHLSFLLNGRRMSRDPNFPKYLQILDRMPKADRDILLAWLDYTIKKYEYEKKTKPLLDSIRNNAPRFIETIPSNSSSTTMKNK